MCLQKCVANNEMKINQSYYIKQIKAKLKLSYQIKLNKPPSHKRGYSTTNYQGYDSKVASHKLFIYCFI